MKQSRSSISVRTSLLGAAGMTLALTGCEEAPTVVSHVYDSAEQCITAGLYPEATCHTNFNLARDAHLATAPRYEDKDDCEADYGVSQCEARPEGQTVGASNTAASEGGTSEVHHHHSSGGGFIPFMIGYWMGGGFDSNNNRTAYQSTPVYREKGGTYRTASGTAVPKSAFNTAGAKVTPTAFKQPASPTTFKKGYNVTKRGGFGNTGNRTFSRSFGS